MYKTSQNSYLKFYQKTSPVSTKIKKYGAYCSVFSFLFLVLYNTALIYAVIFKAF